MLVPAVVQGRQLMQLRGRAGAAAVPAELILRCTRCTETESRASPNLPNPIGAARTSSTGRAGTRAHQPVRSMRASRGRPVSPRRLSPPPSWGAAAENFFDSLSTVPPPPPPTRHNSFSPRALTNAGTSPASHPSQCQPRFPGISLSSSRLSRDKSNATRTQM